MKKILNNIRLFFCARNELEKANRYISFMEEEMSFLRESLDCAVGRVADLGTKNESLNLRIKVMANTASNLRERLHSNGCTQTELEFLRVCEDIYNNGKMITQMRFDGMVGGMIAERARACINRTYQETSHEKLSLLQERK